MQNFIWPFTTAGAEKFFRSDSQDNSWNGRISNTAQDATDGIYYYVLRVAGPHAPSKTYNGFLSLVRNR